MNKDFFEENIEQISKPNAPDSKKLVANYIKQMQNFESDRIVLIKNQNGFLKKIVVASLVVAILSVGAVIGLTPLKTVEPYLVRVDNATGAADIIRPLANNTESYEEKMDRFWLWQAINERESYNWQTVQSSYDKFKLFSTPDVFTQYETYIYGDKSPLKEFGDTKIIELKHRGTSFIESGDKIIAQVRLSKTILEKSGKPSSLFPVTYWQATATFDYNKDIKRVAEEEINPLGFRLTSYRIDPITE